MDVPENIVFISIGSNIEPERNVPACLDLLQQKFDVLKTSSIFESPPFGPAGQSHFWNAVVEMRTDKNRAELVSALREIEDALGRKRDPNNKFAPRTIDLDILPQEGYQELPFIMVPLAQIAPQLRDADSGRTMAELSDDIAQASASLREIQ